MNDGAQHPRPHPTENRFAERDRIVRDLVGLTLAEAKGRVRAGKGLTLRVHGDPVTADINRMRITVRVVDGLVATATVG